jgi:hypothetical protein
VVVRGVCVVKGGQADIEHDLIVSDGAALLAIFGRRHARLTVGGDVFVGRHGTLIMGCESKIISVFGHRQPVFPCADDPHQRHPTLNSHGVILGALIAHEPLGIVIHNSFLREDVVQRGGGGGVSCKPTGIFRLFGFPPYSDYEDSVFGDSLSVTGVHSCWFGALRNVVGIDLHVSRNRMADPDAMEVLGNLVLDNLSCSHNVPLVHFGDSGGHSNRVAGSATGGCGFRVLRWNPARGSHIPVKPRLEHISVHLRDVLAPEST